MWKRRDGIVEKLAVFHSSAREEHQEVGQYEAGATHNLVVQGLWSLSCAKAHDQETRCCDVVMSRRKVSVVGCFSAVENIELEDATGRPRHFTQEVRYWNIDMLDVRKEW